MEERHEARHGNVATWDLKYPPGTRFAEDHALPPEARHIVKTRYTDPGFLALEVERLWKRVWQMACRVEDVPQPGDYVEYTVADQTYLIVHAADGQIRALEATCRHRGNLVRTGCGNAQELRCRYHHWCYDLDGTLKEVPDRELFADVDASTHSLVAAACDTWGGFVFMHPSPAEAPPLSEFLGAVADQLDPYHLDRMRASKHALLHLACNWKVAVEAFLEVYHVQGIHPQLMPVMDDLNTAYEILGEHSRMIVPYGVPSMRLDHVDPDVIYEGFIAASRDVGFKPREDTAEGTPEPIRLPDTLFDGDRQLVGYDTVRQYFMKRVRQRAERSGHDLSDLTDEQMVDDYHYVVFPGLVFNLHAGGFLLFRVRPDGRDPDHCWFDLWTFRLPDPSFEPVEYDPTVVTDIGSMSFGRVLDQDFGNLPGVQRGLHNDGFEHVTLSTAEVRIVALNETLDRYLSGG